MELWQKSYPQEANNSQLSNDPSVTHVYSETNLNFNVRFDLEIKFEN